MSTARARANQSLYLARVLLASWRREEEAAQTPVKILAQAFAPAVQAHLHAAYGWFLLYLVAPAELPAQPPQGVADLPPPPPGRVLPGEINEFRQLECDSWLAQLLSAEEVGAASSATMSPDRISSQTMSAGPQEFHTWSEQLQAIFARMDDSVDEY